VSKIDSAPLNARPRKVEVGPDKRRATQRRENSAWPGRAAHDQFPDRSSRPLRFRPAFRQATRRAEHSHVVTNLGQQRGRGQWGVKSVTVTERRPRAGHAKATPTDDVIRGPCEDRNHPVILVLTARRGSESPTPTCTIGGRITAMINSTGSTAAINGTVVRIGAKIILLSLGFSDILAA